MISPSSTVISCTNPRIPSGHPGLALYMFCLSRAGLGHASTSVVEKSKAATAIHLRQEATASHPIGEKGDVVTVESFVHQRHNSLPHFLVTLLAIWQHCWHVLAYATDYVNKMSTKCARSVYQVQPAVQIGSSAWYTWTHGHSRSIFPMPNT